jgi:hypothetical protein
MKTPKELYLKEGKEITALTFDKAVAAFAKEQGLKKPDAEEFIKDALKGEEYDYTDVDTDTAKAHKAHAKAALKLVKDSEDNKKELHERLLEQEEANLKKKEQITVAAEKGATAADKFGLAIASDFQKLLGPKFVADQYGLSLAEGKSVSEDDMSLVISTLAEGSEKVNELRSQTLIKLGDAARIIRKEFGDEKGDELIVQAVEVRGQGKHNVMQSEAVMEYIDSLYPDRTERPISLSFTHLQEAKNYGRNKKGEDAIPKAKVKKILAKAVEEKLSCADMRELLKAARPQAEPTPGPNGDGGGEESEADEAQVAATEAKSLYGYLYTEYASGNDFFSEDLREDLLKEKVEDGSPAYKVIDLARLATLKPSGKVLEEIGEPPVA